MPTDNDETARPPAADSPCAVCRILAHTEHASAHVFAAAFALGVTLQGDCRVVMCSAHGMLVADALRAVAGPDDYVRFEVPGEPPARTVH